jgi:proteasome lid subunit RPN8/RPN11
MIFLPEHIFNECVEHAKRESPIESCGIFGGMGEKITTYFPMTNIDNSPDHFSLDPKEQFSVIRNLREQGLKMIGVVHSHPQTLARMSREDKFLAVDQHAVYFILSLASDKPVLKAFQHNDNESFDEIPVNILYILKG